MSGSSQVVTSLGQLCSSRYGGCTDLFDVFLNVIWFRVSPDLSSKPLKTIGVTGNPTKRVIFPFG